MRRSGALGPAGHPDAGVALPLVVGTMAVVCLMLLTALGLAMSSVPAARADQGAKAAVAAAQAGADEYISRLNDFDNYWERGNVDPANPAFTTGAPVPGAGAGAGRFTYRLMTTPAQVAASGQLLLEVTGTASAGSGREVSRTLTARLAPRGFLDYVYFTDVESTTPVLSYDRAEVTVSRGGQQLSPGSNADFVPDPTWYLDRCSRRHADGRGETTYTSGPLLPYYRVDEATGTRTMRTDVAQVSLVGGCREIQWTTGDVVDGPLHSNDALLIEGAVRFGDPTVTSSWSQGDPAKLWRGGGIPVGPTASPPGHLPTYAPPLPLPPGNLSLLKHVLPKVDTDPNTDRPGCLYTGATRITFVGGQMKVLSPNTSTAGTPSRCLDVANRGQEQTKPIPPVIHIAPATGTCTGVGYPRAGERIRTARTTDYAPCRANAYVGGTVDGQVTVSAENAVVVTADLTLQDRGAGTDIVGLVAGNSVWVYHPVNEARANLLPYDQAVRSIEASILSLRESFVVQNWDRGADLSATGPTSRLRVFGAIAQKFRGPVGTGGEADGSGYTKNYVYDRRLGVLQPPYFLTPDKSPWAAEQITDG